MLELPIPECKIPSAPEYCRAFQLHSFNSFLPQGSQSHHVIAQLSITTSQKKIINRKSQTFKAVCDLASALSLSPLLYPPILPPCPPPSGSSGLHTSFLQTLKLSCTRAFAIDVPPSYNALPLIFQWLVPSCHSGLNVIFSERLPR